MCLHCGACCAAFRVSFYWAEAPARGIEDFRIERVSPWLASLVGTNRPQPRCHALEGEVGVRVHCGLYERRPTPCREVMPGDERCGRARSIVGLAPLTLPDATT